MQKKLVFYQTMHVDPPLGVIKASAMASESHFYSTLKTTNDTRSQQKLTSNSIFIKILTVEAPPDYLFN